MASYCRFVPIATLLVMVVAGIESTGLNLGAPEDLVDMYDRRGPQNPTLRFFWGSNWQIPTFPPNYYHFPTVPPIPFTFPNLLPTSAPPSLEGGKLWTNRTVVYKFESGFKNKDQILASIDAIQQTTCLRFKHIDGFINYLYPYNHVIIRSSHRRCRSTIGMKGSTPFGGDQTLSLADACRNNTAPALHFLLHVAGVYHEHSRDDRMNHVTVRYENVNPAETANMNISRHATTNYTYDLMSVTHFGPFAYSKDGGETLLTNEPEDQGLMIYPRPGLSFMDKRNVNFIYGCVDDWMKQCSIKGLAKICHHEGYINSTCGCECPPGTEGDTCENKTRSYEDALRHMYLPNNAHVNTTSEITSGSNVTRVNIFSKVITAPVCHEANVTVLEFDTAPRCPNGWCCTEGVMIKQQGPSKPGQVYCGTELHHNRNIKSVGGNMVVFYYKDVTPGNLRKGMKMSVTFEPIPGCVPPTAG